MPIAVAGRRRIAVRGGFARRRSAGRSRPSFRHTISEDEIDAVALISRWHRWHRRPRTVYRAVQQGGADQATSGLSSTSGTVPLPRASGAPMVRLRADMFAATATSRRPLPSSLPPRPSAGLVCKTMNPQAEPVPLPIGFKNGRISAEDVGSDAVAGIRPRSRHIPGVRRRHRLVGKRMVRRHRFVRRPAWRRALMTRRSMRCQFTAISTLTASCFQR